ncbi:hemerythrin domain-containing protein [Nannocystis pusilla]|uniref:hemerythrin domain-containing protein n=1 Tax=Nannocystis pusilla TaxID=889268 RepID=UPI003BEFF8AB
MAKPQIYDVLHREHEEVSELFHQLEEAKGAEALELFARLKQKLVPHARAEEAVVYPRFLEEQNAADTTREGIEEHKQVDNLIAELDAMTPDNDGVWKAKIKVLADMVGHHVDEEEGELFPLAKQVVSDREAEQLAEEYARERDSFVEDIRADQRDAAE